MAAESQQASPPVQQPSAPTERPRGSNLGLLGDIAGSGISGLGGIGTAIGGGTGLVTGDYDTGIMRLGRRLQRYGESLMSPELLSSREKLERDIQEAGERGPLAEAGAAARGVLTDPRLFGSFFVEQVPQLVGSLGVGRLAGAAGQYAARRGGAEAAAAAGRTAAVGTAVATGTALQTGDVADATYQDVINLAPELIERSPNYQSLRQSMTDEEARHSLGVRAAREAAAIAAPISAGTAALFGAERFALGDQIKRRAISRVVLGATGEGLQEGTEEGGGRFAQNVGASRADIERDLAQGVGGAAARGAIIGAGLGGATGLVSGSAPDQRFRGEDADLRGALDPYLTSVRGAPVAPSEPEVADQVRFVTENLPITAEQFLNAGPRAQEILINRAQREAEGRQSGENLRVRTPEGQRVPQSASAPSDELISGQAGSRAEAFQFEEGRAEPMEGGITQAEFFRRRAEEMARAAAPAPTVAADEGLLRAARATQSAPQGTSAERTVRGAQSERARQEVLSPFFPLVENYIGQHVQKYGPSEPISVPAFQSYVRERTGQTLTLTQAREVLQTYNDPAPATARENVGAQEDAYPAINPRARAKPVPRAAPFSSPAQGEGFVLDESGKPVAPKGVNTDAEGRPLPPAPTPAAPLRAGRSGFTDPRMSELSGRAAEAEAAATEQAPAEQDDAAVKRATEIVNDRLNKIEKRGGKKAREAVVRAINDGRFDAEQVYGAFMAAEKIASLLPPGANHEIEFVDRLLVKDKKAAKASGNVKAKEAQGERLRPTGDINSARFQQLMREGATADQAFGIVQREAVEGIIRLSLARNQLPFLRETAAHEAFHVLQDYYGKYDKKFASLMDKTFRDDMMIGDVDPTIRRKLEQARVPGSNKTYWQTLTETLPNPLTAREAQAYAFGSLVDAANRGTPMTGLTPAFARFTNFLRQFFTRMGNALRGDGFQTAESLLGRVGRGDAQRFAGLATPTDVDVGRGRTELSARTSSVELREKPPKVGGTGAGGSKITVKDIGEYFDQANGRTDPNDPAAMQDAIDSALAEVNYQLSQQNTGEKWYEEDVADAFDVTARIIPELNDVDHRRLFSAYTALLSNGTRAGANWKNAAIGYQEFLKTGQFPEQRPGKGTGWTGLRSGITAQQIRMLNTLLKRPEFENDPIGGLTNWLLTTHPVSEIQDFRNSTKIFSGDLASVGTRKDERMGAYILGPKFGPFMLNINGIKDTTTDSWFTRTFNRHFGRMTGPGAVGDAGLVDAPRNPAERRLMKDVFTATLAKETGKTDQAIQAILWYYEQQLFYAMGVKSARSESFSDGAKKFAGSQPGQARGARAEGAARSDAGRAAREGDREAAGAGAGPRPEQGEATAQDGLTEEQTELSARATNTSVPEFTNWWSGGWREGGPKKASVARNKDGSPMPYYHGTGGGQFSAFANATSGAIDSAEGPFFFSPEPSFTDDYTGYSDPDTGASPFPGARVIPVFLSVQKPFDSTDPKRQAELIRFMNDLMLSGRVKPDDILFFSAAYPINQAIASGELTPKEGMAEAIAAWRQTLADPDISWKAIEKPIFQKYIRGNGFDSFYVIENGVKNLAVYNPRQIKSIFNKFEPGAATQPEFSAREVKTDRIQALEDAANGIRAGTVTREQYEQLVNNLKPVLPYAEVPEPATEAQIIRALELTEPKKVEKAGVPSETLERGHPVGLRLDIPSYTNQNTWVVAVHEVKGQNFYAGTPIGYEPTAIATNVRMGVVPKAAFDIAAGLKNKSTIAVMRGEWQPATPQEAKARADAAMNDPNWAQVGMDPRRHQYFYNRTTMQPVVGADEVIQIGPLVLAKNPVYASKSEFEYSARDIGNETIGNRIQNASPADIRAKQFEVEYTNTADMINRGLRKVPFVGKRVKDTTAEDLIIKMQDRMLPLGRMVDEVRKSGGTVVDASDIYMTEELYHGRAGAAVDDRAKRLYKPVFDAMRTLGVSEKDLDDYLTARHAPERNAFVRSINEDQSKGAGITDREAADIMQRLAPQKAKLDKVAKLVDDIVADTNKTRSGNGLTPDYLKLNSKTNFKHYVPLKGFADEDVFDDRGVESLRARTGQGFKIRGKEDRSVMGRQSRAANVLGNVILQNEESVIRAEKNKVGQALLKLIRDNPQQAGRFAKILEVAPVEPRIVNGKVKLVSSGTYRNRDDVMVVKEGGNEVAVEIYDPRIAKALTGATGLGPENSNVLFDAMLKLNRYLAQVNTTLNPEFVISNFARDLQTANINIKQFDVKGLGRKIITDVPSALAGARAGIREGRTDTRWAKAYDDFRKAGGTTEFLGLRDLEGKIKQINDEVMGNKGPLVARPFKTMLKFIEDYNSVAENGIRLSTFQALRDMGVSDAKAAQVAKNLTVNFNKGGENRVFMNAMYLFYNASIQGSMAMANAITRSKRVRKYVAGIVVAGFMQDVINAMISGMDDDEKKIYDKVPDYVLERNYVMMDPFGFTERGYYAFPMPYGFNAFFNMGRNLARVSRGQGDPMQTAGSIVMGFADAFNPIGGTQSFFNFVAPTILDPLVDLYSNRNFAGRPISPEQGGFGPPSPDSQRFWSNTFPPYVTVSQWLNQITGGTSVIPGAVDISPNTIGYLTNYATGAAGAFAERVAKFGFSTVPDALTGDLENVEMRDIPFVRKLYGNVTRRNDLEAFMENTNKIAQIQREFSEAEKYGQVERIERAMRDYPRELAAAPLIEDMVKERRKITREINEIRRDPNMDEETKRVLIRALSQEADFYVGQANRIYNTMVRN
jgi:hypothetical protein